MTDRQYKPKKLTRAQIKEGLDTIPMDTLILGVNAEAKLTHKQREFARLVALGESKAQSYRNTYNTKGNKNTQRVEAHKLSRTPNVSNMIAAFAQAKQFTDSHTPEQLRSFVIQQLAAHAANEDNPPAVRIKALQLIGQHSEVQSFETRAVVTHVKASGDIRSRIMDKLKLIGASTTVEAEHVQDDTQDADSLLQELNETHTIEPGAICLDEGIPDYQPDSDATESDYVDPIVSDYQEDNQVSENTGFNQRAIVSDYNGEIDPTASENAQDVTHRTHTPP